MAINLASNYSDKIAERFQSASKTDDACGHDYEFSGVKTVKIYSINTVPTGNYTSSGTARFGTLSELEDTTQELTVTQDKAFTFSIDAGNNENQINIKHANACLKRQWDEVCTPEIDKYRFQKWVSGNGLSSGKSITVSKDGVLTKSNIVEKIFTASAQMSDDLVPASGRTLFIPELTFLKFKLADMVIGSAQLGEEDIKKGYRGTIDGMRVVTVPSTVFPAGYNFIIKYKNATVDPMKLKNLRVTKNPVGIDGDVVEGRYMYDSFVLDSMCKGVFASSTATA